MLRRLLSERLGRSAVAVRTDIDVTDIRRVGQAFRLYANDKSAGATHHEKIDASS